MEPYEAALQYVGTPFRHMGRDERHGVDCIGLLMLVARDLSILVEDNPHYGREPALRNEAYSLRDYLIRNCGEPIEREWGPLPNDILLMQLPKQSAPGHLGMVTPHPYGIGIVHTYGQVKKVVHHRLDTTWSNRIIEVYQCPV